MGIRVEVYDRSGRSIEMPSITSAAVAMNVSAVTIRRRLRDGLWIVRDGYVPVRVRRV